MSAESMLPPHAGSKATAVTSTDARTAVVTGAFGYSGRHIADRLLRRGVWVRTLTNHPPERTAPETSIEIHPLDFNDPSRLRAALSGAAVVYNTYWVRYAYDGRSHELAVRNTKMLIDAALAEGVGHFVHVSIANPDDAPQLTYYRGKAELESYLRSSGLPFSVVRPTVVYGHGDVLINNIAWFLRHMPAFGIPGDGSYRMQPVYVEDYADLVVKIGEAPSRGLIVDAVGPDSYTFIELVALIREAVRSRSLVVKVPPRLALFATSIIGRFLGDVVLTAEEIEGLMAGLLTSRREPTCATRFAEWLTGHHDKLGRRYASELARRR